MEEKEKMNMMNQIDHRPEHPDKKQWSTLLVSCIIIGAVMAWGIIGK